MDPSEFYVIQKGKGGYNSSEKSTFGGWNCSKYVRVPSRSNITLNNTKLDWTPYTQVPMNLSLRFEILALFLLTTSYFFVF